MIMEYSKTEEMEGSKIGWSLLHELEKHKITTQGALVELSKIHYDGKTFAVDYLTGCCSECYSK